MLTHFQALILGALQGITELFPISSLGHSVLLPYVLGWKINQGDNYFLLFLVSTHLATALVLLQFFFNDWMHIIQGIFRSLKHRYIDQEDTYQKLGWLLIVGTIPAGIFGLLFQDKINLLFASPIYVSLFLLCNGLLLWGVESLRKSKKDNSISHDDKKISMLTWAQSIKIGFAQALALLPGFSRTGASLGGGLVVGLDHKNAARFSFLLATPLILAAALLKLPDLIGAGGTYPLEPLIIGFLMAGITAYISVRYLTKYFETKTLKPFAFYCVVVGAVLLVFFLLR